MNATAIRERTGLAWQEKPDGWWCRVGVAQVRDVARAMRVEDVRFVALTLLPEGDIIRFAWHWDCAGVLLTAESRLSLDQPAPSVVDLWPGADWAEREARDYFAVTFSGRESVPPLMLRQEDVPGVLLRSKGRERA